MQVQINTHAQFDDAEKQCTWVDELGVRCLNAPVKGSATSSTCTEHQLEPVDQPNSVPLTIEEASEAVVQPEPLPVPVTEPPIVEEPPV